MAIPEPVRIRLAKGRRNILRLQALGLFSYVLFGPGLLGLSFLEINLETPALWILRVLGVISTILMFLTAAETRGKLRNYLSIENALRDEPTGEIRATLDDTPFRGVVIPKVWIQLSSGTKAVYLLDEREAAAVVEYFRQAIPPPRTSSGAML